MNVEHGYFILKCGSVYELYDEAVKITVDGINDIKIVCTRNKWGCLNVFEESDIFIAYNASLLLPISQIKFNDCFYDCIILHVDGNITIAAIDNKLHCFERDSNGHFTLKGYYEHKTKRKTRCQPINGTMYSL